MSPTTTAHIWGGFQCKGAFWNICLGRITNFQCVKLQVTCFHFAGGHSLQMSRGMEVLWVVLKHLGPLQEINHNTLHELFFLFLAQLQDSFLLMLRCIGATGPSTSQLQQGLVWLLIYSSIHRSTLTKILLVAGMGATEEQSVGKQMGPPRQASC